MSAGLAFDAGFALGSWRLERRILDRLARGRGAPAEARFRGAATLSAGGGGVIEHVERGRLSIRGRGYEAARRYAWRLTPDAAELLFDDGRLLMRFAQARLAVGARATGGHDCAPDRYDGALRLLSRDAFQLSWRVRGPRKDFLLSGRFTRALDSDAAGRHV